MNSAFGKFISGGSRRVKSVRSFQRYSSSSGFIQQNSQDRVYTITLNRPAKKNAITGEMYGELEANLRKSAECQETSVTVIRAVGDYYCSGNDLTSILNVSDTPEALAKYASYMRTLLESFVRAFIDHPKPLIAAVHGPAVGIAVTTLALCDLVIASDKAVFNTPFTKLGQTPEGCSSFTFPRLMGTNLASDVLLAGKKLNATEAHQAGLVGHVLPHDHFETSASKIISRYAQLPPQSLRAGKQIVRASTIDHLHAANDREVAVLEKCWQAPECRQAITNFFISQKSKQGK